MKQVALIGAGHRARGALLPALWALRDRYALHAVYARTTRSLELDGHGGTIAIRTDLRDGGLREADLVVVAVATDAVPAVLAGLRGVHGERAVLMLDTPVLPPNRLAATRNLAGWSRVLVSEDNLALPTFLLARRLIDDGAIGRLGWIGFFHNGYKHHALASLRMLAGAPIVRLVDRRFAGKLRRKELALGGEVSAVIYEPRDYAIGRFLIRGEAGVIADHDHPGSGPVRRIGVRTEGEHYVGLTLDGTELPPGPLDLRYRELVGQPIHRATPMNTLKLRGLIDLLDAALAPDSPFHYPPAAAIADHLAIRMAERVGIAWPASLERLLGRAGRLAARVQAIA